MKQMIIYLPWLAVGLFAIVWLFFFFHCLRCKNIYRPFNLSSWIVKLFWITFFCTLSPIALIAYLPFGLILRHRETPRPAVHVLSICILAGLFYLAWPFLPSHPTMNESISWEKEGGEWALTPETGGKLNSGGNGFHYKHSWHMGFINSSTNISTTSVSSSSPSDVFEIKRIALFLETENPLLLTCIDHLIEELRSLPSVERVDLIPSSSNFPSGGILPDIYIRIGVENYREIYFPPQLKIDGEITLTISSCLYQSTHSYHETFSPPVVDFWTDADLTHRSQTTAVSSRDKKYKLPADEIEKELLKQIKNTVSDLKTKYKTPPSELALFTLESAAPPAIEIPSLQEIDPIVYGTRPLTLCESHRIISATSDVKKPINLIGNELETAGWKKQSDGSEQNPYARYEKDNERIEIYSARRPHRSVYNFDTIQDAEKKIVVTHNVWIRPEEVIHRLQELEFNDCDLQFLLLMKNWIYRDETLKKRYRQALINAETKSPTVFLELAYQLKSMKETERQWIALKSAEAMENTIGSEPSQDTGIKQELERFYKEHPDFNPTKNEDEIYKSLGAIPLPDKKRIERTEIVGLMDPIVYYWLKPDGSINTISVYMLPNPLKDNISPYALRIREREGGGSSASTYGGQRVPNVEDQFRWEGSLSSHPLDIQAESETESDGQFRITLTIQNNAQ